jgi:hypothetical protein
MRRAGSKTAVFAASAVIAVGAWTPAVRAEQAAHAAAGPPGWRLAGVFGSCFGIINSLTATGVSDAWAAGEWYGCGAAQSHDHQVARWNGSAWQELPHAPGFGFGDVTFSSGTAVAALSSSYSWAFIDRRFDPQPTVQSFALQWRGGRWRTFRLADGSTITSAAAFSRTDAWAFGSIPSGQAAAAYAVRFDGKQWRRVPIPVLPQATAAPGPRNIWAVGPVPKAAAYPFPRRWALTHWTGRWHTTPLPNLNLSPGRHINSIWVVTDGSGGAWVAITLFNNGPQPYANGGVLLHWTGKRWLTVIPPFLQSGLGPLAHDGHGGIWIASTPVSSSLGLLHLSATGAWSQAAVPSTTGFLHLLAMRQIPGTGSVWAAGIEDIPSEFGGDQVGVMLKYGP